MQIVFETFQSFRRTLMLFVLLFFLGATVYSDQSVAPPNIGEEISLADPLSEFLASPEPWEAVQNQTQSLDKVLDKVHRFSHRILFAPGKWLFVTEYFTLNSVLREPARAAVFLTGPEFRGNFWDIPVEGYSAPAMAARRGFFAYTFDYVGVGESFRPEDGRSVNYLSNAAAVRVLIKHVQRSRNVEKVDLIGEHYGVEVASVLARDPGSIRSVVMSTVNYKEINAAIVALLYTEEFEAFLRSQPNGYWKPGFLPATLAFSPNEELRSYVFSTQAGVYPTGPILQFWDFGLPVIDAQAVEMPLLLLAGELDVFLAPGDMENLVAEWGGDATLVVIPGGHKAPRIENEQIAGRYFQELFDFIDP